MNKERKKQMVPTVTNQQSFFFENVIKLHELVALTDFVKTLMFRVNNKTRLAASVWASFYMVFYQAAYYQTLGLHDILLTAFFCHLITVQQLFFSKERCFSCLISLKTAGF